MKHDTWNLKTSVVVELVDTGRFSKGFISWKNLFPCSGNFDKIINPGKFISGLGPS